MSVDFASYQTSFESRVAAIGDLHIYNLPAGFGYNCYEVVGIEYAFHRDLDALYVSPMQSTKGVEGEIAFRYNYEGERILSNGQQLVYQLFIDVYIDRTP